MLLEKNELQTEALLVTATNKQVVCISELARNILRLPVSSRTKKLLKQHSGVLESIGDKKKSIQARRELIQEHSGELILIVYSIKNRLLQIL